jgi:hypothetical protein
MKKETNHLLAEYKGYIVDLHPLTSEMLENISKMKPEEIKEIIKIYDAIIQHIVSEL